MKSKNIALGGILVALSVLLLYCTSLIPSNTITFLTIASSFIPICMIRSNVKNSILVYLATIIISYFIVPITYVVMYALFFGVYGIVKYFIELLCNITLELILKFVYFNISLFAIILILKYIVGSFVIKIPFWLLIVLAQPFFFIYTYALTLLISLYMKKIHFKI